MSKKHPYRRFENDPLWREVSKAIAALVKNGDLEERTARTHIVGYLTQALHQSKVLTANGEEKPRRVIRIGNNEEVVVRAGVA